MEEIGFKIMASLFFGTMAMAYAWGRIDGAKAAFAQSGEYVVHRFPCCTRENEET